ncbi:hypothetical protein IFM89_002121 [Coptis chinensis]|uniref:ABC-2 type transporter transmembrane domain-containing protein n=1 Tax=Coptis chinensis TaxID=261450 RepID=A0A835H0W5_9MAGN|nr:hypothetical protein IFM89_002121 [Coptis chinensis]
MFAQLILMKRGDQMIYSGPVGQHSSKLIEYFLGIPEDQLGLDFAHLYRKSQLHEENKKLVEELSVPAPSSRDIDFPTQFPQNGWEQYKACLWKQHLSYWRSPHYNLVRIYFMIFASVLFGAAFWQKGKNINTEQDLFNILEAIFALMQFLGINNCSSVLPFVSKERTVLYREKFAGMYSSLAYSFSQMTIEIPYIFFLTVIFVTITYPAIGFYWSTYKVIWAYQNGGFGANGFAQQLGT